MLKTKYQQFASAVTTAAFILIPTCVMADALAPDPQTARYEVRFMVSMIHHHEMAVMMAEMCLDRAVHEELMDLCEQIRTSQTEEIEQMASWLRDWYGIESHEHMNRGGQRMRGGGHMNHNDHMHGGGRMMEQLEELTGEDFEIMFMEMMVRHHETAVRDARNCADRAYHAELIALCENMVETQTHEIELMQTWLCEWYDICR